MSFLFADIWAFQKKSFSLVSVPYCSITFDTQSSQTQNFVQNQGICSEKRNGKETKILNAMFGENWTFLLQAVIGDATV